MKADVLLAVKWFSRDGMVQGGKYHKLVSVTRHPTEPLAVLNYTPQCQYGRLWDPVTMACRGLVVNTQTFKVEAWPLPKFFSLNETEVTKRENLPDGPFRTFEKLDGCLGILVRSISGDLSVATRGSFIGEQARKGSALITAVDKKKVPNDTTLLFEVIYHGQKRVLSYDFEGLVLLAAVDTETGQEWDWHHIKVLAKNLGLRVPQTYPFKTLDEVLRTKENLTETKEGFVLRYESSGLRVKIKGDPYLDLHKIVYGISAKLVLEALVCGNYEELATNVPEEVLPLVEGWKLSWDYDAILLEIEANALYREAPKAEGRKAFALWVSEKVPQKLKGSLFQMYDGKSPNWYQLLEG